MSASIKARSRPSALDSNAAGGSAGGVDASGQQSEFLEVNPAFQEMLTAIEGFDARSTSGESCSQYEIAFYGALRTMMRECLFTAEPRERNAHISKVHSWFSEKRSRSAPSAAGAAVAPTPRRANRSGLAPAQRPVTAPSRAFPQVTSDDPERQERRLRYVQRQLSSVQPPAPQSADLPSIHIASESSRSPSPSASPLASPQRTRDPWLSSSAQITSPQRRGSSIQLMPMHRREKSGRLQSHFRTRDLSASRMRREGTPIPEAPQQQLETANDIEQAEKVLRDMWVDKRRLEEVERQGQEDVRRALVSWATQRARVNEEIARKQESSRFASRSQQLYSRPNSRPTTAKSRGSGSSPTNMKVHMDFGIDEDSDHSHHSSHSPIRSDTDVVDATLKESSRPLPDQFLHPPRSPLRPGSSGGLMGSRPGTAGRRGKGSGSGNEENLSPYKSRPSGLLTSEDSDADRSSLHGFTSPFKVRDDRQRPFSASARLGSRMRPSSAAESSRLDLMTEVDRIKRNFSRYKIACPIAVIERGLSVPQDKSHAECLSLLPTTGSHLRIADPFKAEKATKKKGAAKKGKGKKK